MGPLDEETPSCPSCEQDGHYGHKSWLCTNEDCCVDTFLEAEP